MRNRKNDIERYLRGELSPAEMHALEKEALNDPFLAEALEGIEHAGADNFLYDLHQLNKSVHHRTRKNKTIKMWGLTVGIAASVLLIAVSGFLVVSLLKNQKNPDMAMKEQRSASLDIKSQADTVTSALEDDETEAPAEKQGTPGLARQQTIRGPIKPTEPVREEKEAVSEKDQLLANEQSISENESESEKISATDIPEGPPQLKQEDAAIEKELAKKLEGRAAGLEAEKRAPAVSQTISRNSRLLTGNVVSAEDGTALPGVNVLIKGTNIGTVTDAQGNFQLSLPTDQAKLVFSLIGFESTEVEVGDRSQVNVQLPGDAAQLSEVIVTGYGYTTDNTPTEAASFQFAEPEGGRNGFKNYLSKEVKYPEEALKNKAEGKVTIRFTVEPDGQLTDFQIIKGIGYGCEEELIRLVRQGPAWKPSTKDKQSLRDQVKIRFKFELPKK